MMSFGSRAFSVFSFRYCLVPISPEKVMYVPLRDYKTQIKSFLFGLLKNRIEIMKKNKTAIEHFHLLCLQWLLCHRPKKWCNAHDCTELTVFLTSNLSSFPLYFHPLLKQRRFFCAFLPHLKSHPAANYIYPT